ncbi:ethylbenzene dehydrogenase-related protein [Thauera linaloolentis]|uniref:Denitrification system component cytochrome C-552 n=1 Tax=Thauera linaloolentis (strain DSM 12138 / JCM 21573 / CCUG 41526 / CIP 105981 / IAM 15112 / NBRC 102519 / 47Lol) TaxID=1123367 RepID=N6YZA8_THAL4|nr:ethylbenzene dehydrogenase-related protein [Thauera linaloolentis]ENO85264.1 denitrification system component cytochrome C-552 [Thauera linaloolentis 47Lol = DSM 12138]MCM8564969.1 ethylbenzene dehydrogenase-related protein [Thauera linaloolentis]
MKKTMTAAAIGAVLALGAGPASAAAPADWSKVAAKDITLFYPGVSPLEWIQKGTEHGGARALKKGETCADCHHEEAADMGKKIASGQKIEPSPIPGKAAFIPVKVQAAHDGANLYLRFSWKQPAALGAPKMDDKNPVKIAFMLESGGKVDLADQSGCWATCHTDSRTMPGAAETKTKYVKGASLAEGKFYDLYQWRSGEKKGFDGHVADTRVMEGGSALVSAEGKQDGDNWTVVFTRKLTGGQGDVALEAGKLYNFGFAIHDDNAFGRFHHVSLGYKLGIDAQADITAAKQ